MSKKIYITSIILLVLIIIVSLGYKQIQEETADEKGETLLNDLLAEDFELVGKYNTNYSGFSSFFSSSYSDSNYNSYQFTDSKGADYFTNLHDGSLMMYRNENHKETPFQDIEIAGQAAVTFAQTLFPDFFMYDYKYEVNGRFGNSAIIISQLNSDTTFTGNYIEANMSNDINVYDMTIINSYDPDEKVFSEDEIIEIAYKRSIYTIDCIKAKLSGDKLSLFQNRIYDLTLEEDVQNTISKAYNESDGGIAGYDTNILNRDEIEITPYCQIAYSDVYWWRVYVKNIKGNAGLLYSNRNKTYDFEFIIDPRTGEILFENVTLK